MLQLIEKSTLGISARRQGRKSEGRYSDRLQIGKWRSSNGRETGIEQIRCRRVLVHRDPEIGDYDDEPTVFFRNGQLPTAFD